MKLQKKEAKFGERNKLLQCGLVLSLLFISFLPPFHPQDFILIARHSQSTLIAVQLMYIQSRPSQIRYSYHIHLRASPVETFEEYPFNCSLRIPMSAPKGFNGLGPLDGMQSVWISQYLLGHSFIISRWKDFSYKVI
jgi:hypothetical protein